MDIDARISETVYAALTQHIFPGAVIGYFRDGMARILPFGRLTYEAHAPAVTADTLYDLASVTKSIPTASLILWLSERGRLSLDDPVERFVPEMSPASQGQVHIEHLLTFTTVFDLSEPLSATAAKGREAVLQTIFSAPLKHPSGQHYSYNDASYILLGLVIENVTDKPLDRIANELFFAPLGMAHTTFHPKELAGVNIAPTELTEQGILQGTAQDEKARVFAASGRVAGNAGLFSTAGDLLTFCQMLLDSGKFEDRRYFEPETITRMRKQAVSDGVYGVSLGWQTKHPRFAGLALPPHVFGKDGFSGTMVMLDPDAKRCLVLLSNRTYPKRPAGPQAMTPVRRSLAEAIFM